MVDTCESGELHPGSHDLGPEKLSPIKNTSLVDSAGMLAKMVCCTDEV